MVMWTLMMSSDGNVGDVTAKNSSNHTKFRDSIREINKELIWADIEQCRWTKMVIRVVFKGFSFLVFG
jgi:hypothetical protein